MTGLELHTLGAHDGPGTLVLRVLLVDGTVQIAHADPVLGPQMMRSVDEWVDRTDGAQYLEAASAILGRYARFILTEL